MEVLKVDTMNSPPTLDLKGWMIIHTLSPRKITRILLEVTGTLRINNQEKIRRTFEKRDSKFDIIAQKGTIILLEGINNRR